MIEQFVRSIENEDLKISAHPQRKVNLDRKYSGVLKYDQLVKLRSKLKYFTNDVMRLIYFRREAIEKALFCQDVIDSLSRGDGVLKSHFVTPRSSTSCWGKTITQLSKRIHFILQPTCGMYPGNQ